ncbi:tRNA (adenosine(37)-N6)-threonylcarbamoyltransferase complex ATPase subunit type 1 TsaE [Virgibacillus dakarensis]|uniref:tRNA threonylcarbamoyladenosine biosynthesis protein TsaE n=1 Tax=Lentibacillus populi TaxID=1827502 RepID=A0A9W5X571_9BACI|nr:MULTISPECIES: tRNA (adenosine(37)-N6)-threonylcarbamoyltransferase complex ATPase subunit type 1 TsaE [Bacillaceae]MTW87148.1 tRNA (adenosine(37)-N6)-threonylcarbamoyltransferase complex ATPase subunit type 1 TsaE [Virgibacillus dakarensis]GGB41242.1 tRNA (adenosine(37)-N6)-threonylcarbamoyltransferase complex ATPase subunit type 1 TsaE [Lentibacillus populi]
MSEHKAETHSEQETIRLAERLALLLKPGDVITLEGDLGAGKTTFTKGVARGLGVKRNVNSPTFTIIKEYQGELPLYHMDVYRLEDSDEDIGFSEYFNGEGISIVEWAAFIKEYLPDNRLNIKITYLDEHVRLLEFRPRGDHFASVVTELIG